MTRQYNREKDWLDYRAALICTVIANVNRGKKHKTFQPKDFMPKQEKKEKLTTDGMLHQLMALNVAYGGEVKEKQDGSI